MTIIKKKQVITIAKVIFPLIVLTIIYFEAQGILKDFDWGLLNLYMDRLSPQHIVYIFVLGLVAIFPMYYYDVILLRLFQIDVSNKKLFWMSLSANAYSNLVGFGGIAGATLRSFYYRKYVDDQVPFIKVIAKLSLFYLTGLSILSAILVVFDSPFLEQLQFAKLAVIAVAAYTPILLAIFSLRKSTWNLDNMKKAYLSELLLISFFEWLFVVICIWGISNVLGVHISLLSILPIVILSSCVGIVSMIPGGIGSFDFVFLLGMEFYGVPAELSLLILLFYRLSYYLFPALISTPFVLAEMIQDRRTKSL
ncbi:lysylphosphatidylglycerol synthase domain-containing protein [Cytobacillus gottheilii]|uniref:lysylphosphatidylglycerol synthase domain-containing protein n=1 Tax=Cytobacillus gottheilii TaxID=859144 RepID=UPI0009BA7534|nr:lysylphosphatidylglycerol synthase domain-containing protein [Cytobacillus gottheilii]